MGIIWRSFCELYVVLIQIGEDLRVLRRSAEAGTAPPTAIPAAAASEAPLVAPASGKGRRTAADGDQ